MKSNKRIKRAIQDIEDEARHKEDLEWLAEECDELIRLHEKLKTSKRLTPEERGFLSDVVYFAIGVSLRFDDVAAVGHN